MIRNKEFQKQFVDFSGLTFGKISPMDFDAFFEFGDKLFVFIETKYGKAEMPFGQRLALERVCDATHSETRNAFVFVTTHNDADDIDLAKTIVTEYRFNGQWRKPKGNITLFDAIERIRPK